MGHCHRNGEVLARYGGSAKKLWPYSLATCFYVENRCFHYARNNAPYQISFGEWAKVSEMQPCGCRAFALTKNRKRLDSKAQTETFLGYSSRSKWFIVYTEDGFLEQEPGKMWISRNVAFNMDCFPGAFTSVDRDLPHDRCVETTFHYETGLHVVKGSPDVGKAEVAAEPIPNTGHVDDEHHNTQPQRNDPERLRRNARQPRRLDVFSDRGLSSRTWHYTARHW